MRNYCRLYFVWRFNMIRDGLTFDDVLLVPNYSDIESRADIDISVNINKFKFSHPIIPANMKTVTGKTMAIKIAQNGGLAILHRFMTDVEQLDVASFIIKNNLQNHFALSIGIKAEDQDILRKYVDVGGEIICIDIAHGDSLQCAGMITWIKETFPKLFIIAGNVATASGAERLWMAGADVVKVGIGPGSLCTTRIETGNGVPQLTALMDVYKARLELTKVKQGYIDDGFNRPYMGNIGRTIERPLYIIADGGIKSAGDIVKALCFSDMVMVGNLFAGCDETPGNIININGRVHKEYVGSSTHKANHVEGIAAMVPCKGSYESVQNRLVEGLRSGCSYQGAHNLTELKDNPEFIKISSAGLRESHPHDVITK